MLDPVVVLQWQRVGAHGNGVVVTGVDVHLEAGGAPNVGSILGKGARVLGAQLIQFGPGGGGDGGVSQLRFAPWLNISRV